MATWLNRVSIAGVRNGTTSHTYDPSSATNVVSGTPFTPTAGNLLVVLGGGGVTATTPSGWTLPSGGSAVSSNGVYCWTRTAAGGDTFSTTHNASNWEFVVDIYEFSAGSTFNKAASATGVFSANPGPNLTGLTGTNLNVTAMAVNHSDATPRTVTWGAPAVEQAEYASGISSTNGTTFSTAAVVDDVATSRQMTATHSGGSVSDQVAFSVTVSEGGGGGPVFPTIPTVADGRVAFVNQLNTTATLTGPNLNTLTKAPGDLLIALAGEYQSNAGASAAFTGWAGGGLTWTEIADSTGTAVNRLGVAVARVVTGSESGAVTVTRSGTLVGDASMVVLVIPGAHTSTNPAVSAMATGTGTAAPAALSPPWGAEDTLWIGFNGNGMTNATGSWTANNGAPTNYGDYFGTTPADTSTIGDFGIAVAFRQLNTATETMGAFSQDTSNARNSVMLIAVRPEPPPVVNYNGTAAVSGSGSISTTERFGKSATATRTGTSSLSATGTATVVSGDKVATAAISGTGAVTVSERLHEARRNLMKNPSGALVEDGYAFNPGAGGISGLIAPGTNGPILDGFQYGDLECLITGVTTPGSFNQSGIAISGSTQDYMRLPADSEGKAIAFSCYVRDSAAVRTARLWVRFFNDATTLFGGNQFTSAVSIAGPGWNRMTYTGTVPTGATRLGVIIDCQSGTNWAIGESIDVAGVLLELAPGVGTYFDGDTPDTASQDYVWTGPEWLSQSVMFVLGSLAQATLTGTPNITAVGEVSLGQVNYNGTVTRTATGSLSSTGVTGKVSTAAISGSDSLSATGITGKVSTAALAGAGALSATGLVARSSSAALSGTGSLSASGFIQRDSSAAVSGTSALNAAGSLGFVRSATVSGTAALISAGEVSVSDAAVLAGTSAITASGAVSGTNSATVSGTGAINAAGTRATLASTGIAGVGAVTATGSVITGATAAVSGTGVITAGGGTGATAAVSGTSTRNATGVVASTSTASVAGVGSLVTAGGATGSTLLTGSGGIASSGVVALTSTAVITGSGTINPSGGGQAGASAVRSGAGSITAAGMVARASSAAVAGTSAIVTGEVVTKLSSASLSGTPTFTTGAELGTFKSATIAGTSAISASASSIINHAGTSTLAGSSTIVATGVVSTSASSTISGTGTITASASGGTDRSASVSATGAITAAGAVGKSASATRTGTGSISSTGFAAYSGTATWTGTGTITAAGGQMTVSSVQLSGTVNIVTSGRVDTSSSAALTGAPAFSTVNRLGTVAGASLAGVGAFLVSGGANKSATASLAGTGSVEAQGSSTAFRGATVAGTGTLSASGLKGTQRGGMITGTGAFVVSGVVSGAAEAELAGIGTLSAESSLGLAASAALQALGSFYVASGHVENVTVIGVRLKPRRAFTSTTVGRDVTVRAVSMPYDVEVLKDEY